MKNHGHDVQRILAMHTQQQSQQQSIRRVQFDETHSMAAVLE